MDSQRINILFQQPALINYTDVEGLKNLINESPYYYLPYVILAKYYFNKNEHEFDYYLRHAAIRVNNRAALHQYIHKEFIDNHAINNTPIELHSNDSFLKPNENIDEESVETKDTFLQENVAETEVEIEQEVKETLLHETEVSNQLAAFLEDEEHTQTPINNTIEFNANDNAETPIEIEHDEVVFELHQNDKLIDSETYPTNEIEHLELVETEFSFSNLHHQIAENDTNSEDLPLIKTELQSADGDNNLQNGLETEEQKEPFEIEVIEKEENNNWVDDIITNKTAHTATEQSEEIDTLKSNVEEQIEAEETKVENSQEIEEFQPLDTQKELEKFLDLRKHPVYNLESVLSEKHKESEEVSSEKDFFAWLKQPKISEIHQEQTKAELNQGKEETSTDTEEEDDLIARFIKKNPQITRPKKEFYNAENMAKKSEVFELDFVTETLAQMYAQQGDINLAIKAYEKLILQNPSKKAYFASLIENLKK